MVRRILLVDDNEMILRVLMDSVVLYCEGCHVLLASDAKSALEEVRRQPFDLILTDYWMPGMNGLELARAVREISPDTRIVVMTGLPSRELLEGSERVSLEGFILKPFRLTELQDVLRSLE